MRSIPYRAESPDRASTAIRTALAILAAGLASVLHGAGIPDINDGFEDPPYPLGQSFVTPTGGWSASSAEVMVTNDQKHAGSQSVILPEFTSLTNTVNVSGTNIVWTDCWVLPCRGIEPDYPETNTSSFLAYFDTNGTLTVATPSGWQACSNDVWGGDVAPIATNAFAHISIYQDFASSNSAVFVNDQLVIQDLRFVGAVGAYALFAADNVSSNAWLDDVWIKPVYNPTLTQNRNGRDGADALEVQTYGYAARTLYVGGSTGFPHYVALQDALDAYRQRDIIHINDGTLAGDYTITQNTVFAGADLLNLGNLSVASGATATFHQAVFAATLDLTGGVTMAAATLLGCTSATVDGGTVTIGEGATFSNDTLAVTAGTLQFTATNSHFVSTAAAIDMTGVFEIGNTWNTEAVMGLTFSDSFDVYAAGTLVTNLGFRGWGSQETNSVITADKDNTSGSGRSVALADGSLISNRISTAAQKIWTDCFMIPNPGEPPPDATTGTSSFVSYVDTNGWLVVATNNGWQVCSNYYDQTVPDSMTNLTFARVTVHQDFTAHRFALFINGKLVTASQSFPCGTAVSAYNRLIVDNASGQAYVDDIVIGTNLPPGLDGFDTNQDGLPDGSEIHQYGRLLNPPWIGTGSVFKFR